MSDLSITPSSVLCSSNAVIMVGQAGMELVAGDLIYLSFVGGYWERAGSSFLIPATVAIGWALNHAYAYQPISAMLSDPNFVPGATLVQGETYVVSPTEIIGVRAGKVCPVGDLGPTNYRCVVGVAISTTNLLVKTITTGTTG